MSRKLLITLQFKVDKEFLMDDEALQENFEGDWNKAFRWLFAQGEVAATDPLYDNRTKVTKVEEA